MLAGIALAIALVSQTQSAGAVGPVGQAPDAKAQAALQRDIAADIKEGKEYSEQVDKELKPSDNKEAQARINRIGSDLAAIANRDRLIASWGDTRHTQYPYTFKLVKGKDVNAFSLPGGIIYVYDGLIDFCESDDELAAVLGHEISHAAFRHMATLRHEESKYTWLQIPLLIAAALSRGPDAGNVLVAGQYTMQGLSSGWSVKAEEAADYGGIQILSDSRYNPVGALTFMERLAHRENLAGKVDWGIFQTHPPSSERAYFMMSQLQLRGIPVRRSQVSTAMAVQIVGKEDALKELTFGKNTVMTFRGKGAGERAEIAKIRLDAFFDSVPEAFEVSTDGTYIDGSGRPLFEVTDDDAQGQGVTREQLQAKVLAQIKRCILDLSTRIYLPRETVH